MSREQHDAPLSRRGEGTEQKQQRPDYSTLPRAEALERLRKGEPVAEIRRWLTNALHALDATEESIAQDMAWLDDTAPFFAHMRPPDDTPSLNDASAPEVKSGPPAASQTGEPRADAHADIVESALLSALIADNSLLPDCGILAQHPDWFYLDAHQAIAQTVFEQLTQGKPVDAMLLWEMLKQTGRRARVGDAFPMLTAVAQRWTPTPTAAIVQQYAEQIITYAEERRVAYWKEKLQRELHRSDAELRALLDVRREDLALYRHGPGATLRFQNARDLLDEAIPPAKWAVPGLFAEGLNLFGGGPKSGKTALSTQVLLAVPTLDGKALGHISVTRGEALYLALEDNKRRMQERIRNMLREDEGVDAPEGLFIEYNWPRLDAGGIDKLDRWMDQRPSTRLIVIDTFARIKPPQINRNATLYDSDYASLLPVQQWANARHVAVVVVCHTRKSGAEDAMNEISGSTGLTGVADNIVVMRRTGLIAELHRRGRDYQDDTVWGLKGDVETLLWTYTGDATALKRSTERQAIIDVLVKAAPRKLTPTEIGAQLGRPAVAIRKLLGKMLNGGDVGLDNDAALHLYWATDDAIKEAKRESKRE